MKKTTTKMMLVPTLTIVALENAKGNFPSSRSILPMLKAIMPVYSADKVPFRGTQIKFDKTFYNLMSKRDFHFTKNGKELVNFIPDGSGAFFLSITEAGKRYLKNNMKG